MVNFLSPTSSASLAYSGSPSSMSVPSSCSRAHKLLRKPCGKLSAFSGRSSLSTPSASTSGGCGNMVGLSSAIDAYETHRSVT